MTAAEIAALRALMAKATPGPMIVERDDDEYGEISYGVWCHARENYREVASFSTATNKFAKRDAELFVAMHAALPALLAAAEDAARMREALRRIAAPPDCGCKPCLGQCRSLDSENEGMRDEARAALAPPEEQARAAYLRDAL